MANLNQYKPELYVPGNANHNRLQIAGGSPITSRKYNLNENKISSYRFRDIYTPSRYREMPNKKDPNYLIYDQKFQEYLKNKKKKDIFEKTADNFKFDWDSYVKPNESPNKLGMALKQINFQKEKNCPFNIMKTYDERSSIDNEESIEEKIPVELAPISKEDREIFLMLKDLFDKIDKDNTSEVLKKDLINEIYKNKVLLNAFHISHIQDYSNSFDTLPLNRFNKVTWDEFVESLYRYKNSHPKILRQSDELNVKPQSVSAKNRPRKNEKIENKVNFDKINSMNNIEKNNNENIRPISERVNRIEIIKANYIFSKNRLSAKDYESLRPEAKGKEIHPVTIPKPFKFDQRENQRPPTIRQMKFDEMINEKKVEEDNLINHQFKAQPVPKECKGNKFDYIMKAQDQRRNEIKQNSIKATKEAERPFSFYSKDIKKMKEKKEMLENYVPEVMKNIPKFKAKAIKPDRGKSLKEMNDQIETERKERMEKEKEYIASISHYPENMLKNKEKQSLDVNKLKSELKKEQESNWTFRPKTSRKVPNFRKQQENFIESMDQKTKIKKRTKIEEFNFAKDKKCNRFRDFLDAENQANAGHFIIKERKNLLRSQPINNPLSSNGSRLLLETVF